MKDLNKDVKKLDVWDVGLIKLAVVASVFIILNVWTAAMNFVQNTSVWWFVGALVVLGIRPFVKYWL